MVCTPLRVTLRLSKNYPNLGGRIRAARDQSTKSLVKLADEVGISQVHWRRLENESKTIPFDTLKRMEAALGVDFGISLEDLEEG